MNFIIFHQSLTQWHYSCFFVFWYCGNGNGMFHKFRCQNKSDENRPQEIIQVNPNCTNTLVLIIISIIIMFLHNNWFCIVFNFSATTTQFSNHLNGWGNCARNCAHTDSIKQIHTKSNSIQNVNLLQVKEYKLENIPTISIDLMPKKYTKCNY